MPELPDVEAFRRHLQEEGVHRRIAHVRVRDRSALREVTPQALARSLHDRELTDTSRRGKHMFAASTSEHTLVLHFGMTGRLAIDQPGADRHERVRLDLHDGGSIVLVDQRRLGFVSLTRDTETYSTRHDLGPDALDVSTADLMHLLQRSRGGVKALLMDQSAMAGVGNIYSDEILFQARIDPHRPSSSLEEREVKRLHRELGRVLELAADRDADPERLPRGWLLRHREDGTACPRCGSPVRKVRLVGRGAFWCPGCQH